MMNKLKVGDRIRVKDCRPDVDGATGVITGFTHYVNALMDVPNCDAWCGPEHRNALLLEREVEVIRKPTLATTIGLEPLTRRILNHLEKRGSISPMEALTTYGTTRLAAQIFKLREAGFDIATDLREDQGGHRYARYSLVDEGSASLPLAA